MLIVSSPAELQRQCLQWKAEGLSIGLVPTMGYFHAGHESLMLAARQETDRVVVSLFVNPAQFAAGEDLQHYPRNPEGDAAVAEKSGVDILFTPGQEDMYFPDHSTWITVDKLSEGMCGQDRPLHFRGVATVVAKLFMLAQPGRAYFGEKDWQQLAVIRRMTRDLDIPVTIVGMPLVREPDGLALSSRNAYLSAEERAQAPHLYQGLCRAAEMLGRGTTDTASLAAAVRDYWRRHFPLGREDYLSFVDPDTLEPRTRITGPTLAATAVAVSRARLIDNLLLIP